MYSPFLVEMNFEFVFVGLLCLFIVRFGYPEFKKASTLEREVIGGIVKESDNVLLG